MYCSLHERNLNAGPTFNAERLASCGRKATVHLFHYNGMRVRLSFSLWGWHTFFKVNQWTCNKMMCSHDTFMGFLAFLTMQTPAITTISIRRTTGSPTPRIMRKVLGLTSSVVFLTYSVIKQSHRAFYELT